MKKSNPVFTSFKRGMRVRLVSGSSVGVVRLKTRADGRLIHLIEWENGNEPSFHPKEDLIVA